MISKVNPFGNQVHMDDTRPPFLHLDPWRIGRFPEWSLSFQDIDIIDARKNFSFGVSFRNCHSTHQDAPCPPSLELKDRNGS